MKAHKIMFCIVVSAIEHADCAAHAEPGHQWVVEGDYGFLASYETQTEAWTHAEIEAAVVGAHIVLNA